MPCGDYIFASGQIGLDPATGTVAGETVQVMENLQALLAEGGLDFSGAVQTRIYFTDLADFEGVNAVYAEYPATHPTQAAMQVA